MNVVKSNWIKQIEDHNLTCFLCNKPISSKDDLAFSTIFPDEKKTFHNMCPAHKLCDKDKANLSLEAYWLLKEVIDEGR